MIYKQIAVRKPRLLDKDLNEVKRLQPSMQTIEMNIAPLSTASLTLPDEIGVHIRSFVELYNAKGSVGIFRASLPENTFGSGDRITLEHGICALDDAVVPGMGKIQGTLKDVLTQILTHQTTKARGQYLWQLGDVEAPEDMQISVEHDGTKTLEMLSRAMQELQEYMPVFDQSVFPWLLHVRKKPDTAACEGRLSRNIRTLRVSMDDSDLCTRLRCSLLEGGFIESDTINVWGEVEQEITLNDDMPKEEAEAYCWRYLENRKNPTMAIELDADEWFAMTGERLDRFEIGDICRLALPEYGVTIEERIVAMTYTDTIGRPEAVTVSLANQVVDMSIKTAEIEKKISDLSHSSSGYMRQINTTIAHLKKEDEDFKKINGKMAGWFSKAKIDLDADEDGADVSILAKYGEIGDLLSKNKERIAAAEVILHGGPDGAQAGLIAKVNDNVAALTVAATDIGTLFEVKADIADLGAYATVERLKTELEEFELSLGDSMTLRTLNVTGATSTDSLFVDARASVGSLTVGGTNLKLITKSFLNGNTTIQPTASGGFLTNVEFHRKYTEFHYLGYE